MTKEKVVKWQMQKKNSTVKKLMRLEFEAWEYFQDSLGKFYPKVNKLPLDHWAMFKAGYVTAKMEKK